MQSPTVTYMVVQVEGVDPSSVHYGGIQATGAQPDGDDMLNACIDRHGGSRVPLEAVALMADWRYGLACFPSAKDAVLCADALSAIAVGADSRSALRVVVFSYQPVHGDGVKRVYWHGQHLAAMVHSGQVIVTHLAAQMAQPHLPDGYRLRSLGLHRLLDLQSVEPVYQLETVGSTADFPPLKSLDYLPNNLPFQLTPLVGREGEMAEVKRLLASRRLITLTGAAGCGKTRLAYHLAASMAGSFDDGTWLVDLSTVTDANLVPNALSAVLGVRESHERSQLSRLVQDLQDKRMLIILDTCEHLVCACAELVETLVRSCPQVHILATSREPLQSEGEVVWRVPSLEVPQLDDACEMEQVMGADSVRLLVDRARASYPGFQVTDENFKPIAQICARLGGIPLALEMVAARVGALSVEQIAERLDDRFRLLTGGRRHTLPRHETLRATLDWSYDLLSEKERLLWARLSVFSGCFSLDAAEFVCQDDKIEGWEVLDLLSQSVNKSVIMVEHQQGQAYYWLLETMRLYGQEKLSLYGQGTDVRHRHLEWYRRLALRAEAEVHGEDAAQWLDRFEKEHDNLWAALAWSRTQPDERESGLQVAYCLERLACVATTMRQAARAVRLYAAADLLRPHIGSPVRPSERGNCAKQAALSRPTLGPSSPQNKSEGRTGSSTPGTVPDQNAAAEAVSMVTLRQLEIIQLVTRGLSDKEVAAALHISPNTVDAHLRKIFAKLNVQSRASLVAWAVRNGVDDGADQADVGVPVA
ncbi:MAG TPA: LuxR C-terminal-related transcriptional regulator [Symbiobacteriaceae bacterium]|nr:LuxR C-terminal-related transcriptional regulator [Symbiobacteriaceae bacterium]